MQADLQKSDGDQQLTIGAGREFVLAGISTDNYQVIFEHSNREDLPDVNGGAKGTGEKMRKKL